MDWLKKYCLEVRCIDGLDTYIISPEFYEKILSDNELLAQLGASKNKRRFIETFIKYAKEVEGMELHLAFIHQKKWKDFEWIPVNCLKHGDEIFHICCRENWICHECGYDNPGIVIMPQVEADPTYYEKCPAISSVFQKRACRKCGKTLQNHLLFVDEDKEFESRGL